MRSFPYAEKISRVKNPLTWTAEKNAWMVEACREMAEFHQTNNAEIRALYKRRGFSPSMLKEESDLTKIPSIGVQAMKYFLMMSLPENEAVLKLTSSGTRGQKTQIWFDAESLSRVQAMLDVQWEQEGMISDLPTNYAAFIYDPDDAKDLGIAFSVKNEERFAPAADSFFTVKKNAEGQWQFQTEKTIATLKRYAAEGKPVRFLGIPSFIFELLEKLKGHEPILLPKNSYVITGGGWKAAEDKSVTRAQFRAMITDFFGIPDENIRDGFGMAEHSAPYMECRQHRFHIPVYNRIFARDPETLAALPPGKLGLLEFVTPFNAMMPTLSILSTDLGYIDPGPCGCDWNAPTFTLVGRGGLVKHKGCALTANEIVKRNQ